MNISISVIIPTHNRESTIESAIQSILKQTYPVSQIIVVDDASNDGTVDVVRKLRDTFSQIDIYCLTENHGAQYARNYGIKHASNEWISFLDSDDEWMPEKIQLQVEAMDKHPQCVLYYGNYLTVEQNIMQYARVLEGKSREVELGDVLYEASATFQTMLVKKSTLVDVGLLDESIKAHQEWDTFLRIVSKNRAFFINSPLFIWKRDGGESISSDNKRNILGYRQVFSKNRDIFFQHDREKSIRTYYDWMYRNTRSIGGILSFYYSLMYHLHSLSQHYYGKKKETDNAKVRKNYVLLKKWMSIRQSVHSLKTWFEENNYREIAIYGIGDLGQLLINELNDSNVTVKYVIDKNKANVDYRIVAPDESIEPVDVLVITAIYYFEEIAEMMSGKMKCPIISLEDIICLMEKERIQEASI